MQHSDPEDQSTIPPPSMKESFECGSEDDVYMPNIWLPDGVFPGFKEACLSFYWVSVPTWFNLMYVKFDGVCRNVAKSN